MRHLLALDLGTTNVRAVLFDERMRAINSAEEELNVLYPKTAWVEQDPTEMITKQLKVAKTVIANSKIPESSIIGIGLTNQRETTVLWDTKTGRPVGNAIVWQDRRTNEICKKIEKQVDNRLIYKCTGLLIDPYFSAPKIKWLLDKFPDLRTKAKAGRIAFGTVDSWVIWNLTQGEVHATDPTNASRTMLFNIRTLEWDDDLLEMWEIPKEMLPRVIPSADCFGETLLITERRIPICGVMGDQQAAFFGQKCFRPGAIKCTYGTGCFALLNVGTKPSSQPSKLLTTIAYSDSSTTEYAVEASIFMGGAIVQWLRDGLGIINSAEQVEAFAKKVSDSNGVVLVPAFAGLGAPHWDPNARGTIIGMTRETNKYHIARASLEAIAWQVSDVIELMSHFSQIDVDFIRADGGAIRNNLLMQIQANYLQKPVHRSGYIETTALGVAMLCSLGLKLYGNRDEFTTTEISTKIFKPKIDMTSRENLRGIWNRAVKRSLSWSDI